MLLLSEADVIDLFPMQLALDQIEASFRAQGESSTVNQPRRRILLPNVSLHYMAAAIPASNLLGMKIYVASRRSITFLCLLYQADTGKMLAQIEADHLGRIRTGAASGVATKYLARPDASTVGLIGSGRQARTQLQAVSLVRKLKSAKVFSRNEERRRAFCREMSASLGIEVEPVESAEAAARSADILITATPTRDPVLKSEWVKAGAHVNAIGSNMENRSEVDDALLRRAAVIAVDSIEQARIEAGDLIQGFAASPERWMDVIELWQIVTGARKGRGSPQDVTFFKSEGMALWDVAAAGAIYKRALETGRGKTLELSASGP
ncbi:MAG: ornithine cyclodeaminase family protein [Terriglobia bacterium]